MANSDLNEKLKLLGLESTVKLSEKQINVLYNDYVRGQTRIKKKKQKPIINVDSPKYKLLLAFLNKILTNVDKPNIEKVTDFINVDKDDVISEINNKIIDDMENEIIKIFDREKIGWYRRKTAKEYIMTFLRGACKENGYALTYTAKEVNEKNRKQTRKSNTHIICH